jgi:hypothetical protein
MMTDRLVNAEALSSNELDVIHKGLAMPGAVPAVGQTLQLLHF